MARDKGISAFSANFETQVAAPLDARMRTQSKADLLLSATWTAADGGIYIYLGILVAVYADSTAENNGVYRLTDQDYTQESSWEKLGTGSSSANLISYDNTESGLAANNVQAAIDETVSDFDTHAGLSTSAHGGIVASTDARLTNARTPIAHASTHQSGGTDAIKLDDLAAPDDNTDLNASISKHGLLPKLGGGTTNYLRADGSWATPPGTYSLPTASASTLGGVKVDGTTITISDGVISSAGGGLSMWESIAGVTRTDANTLAKAGLESVLPVGTHVRMYSGAAAPTTLTDWKHGYVVAVGTNAVDICGEEVPTGGASLFVECSTNIAMTMDMPTRKLSGYWAAATGTGLIANAVFSGNVLEWSEPAARLIGAIQIRSATDDSGATQPAIMITSGGTDLLGSALTVGETEANTGVIASGQAVSTNEIIDIDCESTGTNADSYNLRARFLIARHI